MTEHGIQNAVRNALAGECLCFRANTGQAWQGREVIKLANGDLLIKGPRPFNTGLPPGFSDLFGLVAVTITPDMVGQKVGVFFAAEVKTAKGRASEKQTAFLRAIINNGGRAGVVRSPADALGIVKGAV